MPARWYEGSCRLLWRFYSHSADDKTLGKVSESSERRHGDGAIRVLSATSHIIYCLVQYLDYWIHGFPTGNSVKTSCIVIKQISGDSRCFTETSCQEEGCLVFRQSHSFHCYMFCGLSPTGRSVLCPSTFDHQILGVVRAYCTVLRHGTLPWLWHAWKRCTWALYMCRGSTLALHGHDV